PYDDVMEKLLLIAFGRKTNFFCNKANMAFLRDDSYCTYVCYMYLSYICRWLVDSLMYVSHVCLLGK
ncbi:MAG: hypothetical protein ACK53Y_23830, partial [bacterium]